MLDVCVMDVIRLCFSLKLLQNWMIFFLRKSAVLNAQFPYLSSVAFQFSVDTAPSYDYRLFCAAMSPLYSHYRANKM